MATVAVLSLHHQICLLLRVILPQIEAPKKSLCSCGRARTSILQTPSRTKLPRSVGYTVDAVGLLAWVLASEAQQVPYGINVVDLPLFLSIWDNR